VSVLLRQADGFEGGGVGFKRLPPDDLAVVKPEGPGALTLMSDVTGLDPPHLYFSKSDHDVAFCHEAVRDDSRLHVLKSRFEPVASLVVTAQSRPARGLQLNLGIEQREKLGDVAPIIEELGPSTCDLNVLLGHCRQSIPQTQAEARPMRATPLPHAVSESA
jgi:hypothetical protein